MNRKILWGMTIFIVLYFLTQITSHYFIDYEWFTMQGHRNIFWTLFMTKFTVQGMFSLVFIGLFFINVLILRLLAGKGRIFTRNILDRLRIPLLGTPRRALYIIITAVVIVIGFFMGLAASAYWKEYLMYANALPFDGFPRDPVFNKDAGFYIFTLPFLQFSLQWLLTSIVLIAIFSFLFHVLNRGIFFQNGRIEMSLFARAHLSSLAAAIVCIFGFGYRIAAYNLLNAHTGKFYGAGYTATHAQLFAYNVCMLLSLAAAALFIFNIFKRSFKLPVIVLLTLIPAYILLGAIFPSIQQRFIVVPDELAKEAPYIQRNIQFTRRAYNLDRISERPFLNNQNLTYRDMLKNKGTLENVRLWDWSPLQQTYRQLQELKPYYNFHDVDVDRYMLNNSKVAVNLAARELFVDRLSGQSQTWINRHLVYTHGYGTVISRVDRITSEGLPDLLMYDIPPKSKTPIQLGRPEIYYGEHNNPFVITGTSITPGEFDYPYGDTNMYSKYEGTGGSKLDSFFKRLLFSVAFNDINILISGTITKDSRILYRRNILEIAKNLTPFLMFDNDPYPVISGDKIYWILDAYTVANRFPYSTPIKTSSGTINYIRNSVKVVIDAYNGSVAYYIADESDPVIQVYARIFGGLFKNIREMPDDLLRHIRYPEDMFTIQSHILLRYHMTNVNVFYNNEDVWAFPRQIYESSEELMESYYTVSTLPGERESEFILMIPFTPLKKDNMIAFLAAKCDPPHYGELRLYTLPKEKLNYGPMQIEARINQDTEISKQLTLWNQKGSRVIRGNMMIIPIEESLLFVEPLYLKAETSEMPELKRVIISFADRIAMEENLAASLERIFYGGDFSASTGGALEAGSRLREYAQKAYMHYLQAEKYQREGDWAKYGEELKRLRETLSIMKNMQ